MYKINLNCDLGEGAAYDEQIIPLINSANIACGFHAGNHDMMEATAKLCIDNNVDISNFKFEDSLKSCYEEALTLNYKAIVVCGSFYLVSKFKKII